MSVASMMEEVVQNNILWAGRSFSRDLTPLKREMLIEASLNQGIYLLPMLAVFHNNSNNHNNNNSNN